MAATDPQVLFNEGRCFACFAEASTSELLSLALISRWAVAVNPGMATDPQTLLADGKCYACYCASEAQVITITLLAEILSELSPGADVTPQYLLEYAKCFGCISDASLSDMMEIALLDQIANV